MIRERGGRPKDFIAVSLMILFFAGTMLCHCPFLFVLAGIAALFGWAKATRLERVVIAVLASVSLAGAVFGFIAESRLEARVKAIKEKQKNSMTQPSKP
jgi:4-amino-4-deoxy-L-arabinose transferase-like glycosyltransferase